MDEALRHLRKHKEFGPLIKKFGAPLLREKTGVFEALVRSIIYQQVSGAAAATILKRFRALFPGKAFPKPAAVLAVPIETLRAAGLSGQKTAYIRDLAQHCIDGRIREKNIPSMRNDEVIEHLVAVKGIGVWTAHMFLIFTLGRLDVLPVGDLGIQKGFKKLYGLRAMPTALKMEALAKPWRQYASVASWYLWRVADEEKEVKKPRKKKSSS